MAKIDTGGFAFPVHDLDPANPDIVLITGGMTMRQWYATHAMMGMMARDMYDTGQATPEQRAKLAFIEADAMIAEGSK